MADVRSVRALASSIRRPKRLLNLAKYLTTRSRRSRRTTFLPFALDIEPTTYCNFRCAMCHVSDAEFVHRHMPFSLFKQIIDGNPQLLKIHLQGMGEPLLCPDFFNMAEYARKQGILIQTTTNGSMLTGENASGIADLGFSSVGISIDGATAESFEAIRANSRFQKVIEGAERMTTAARRSRLGTLVRAWTVFQQGNRREAVEIVNLCKKIGFHSLTFQVFLSDWGKKEWSNKNSNKSIEGYLQDPNLAAALRKGKEIGLPVGVFTGNMYSTKKPCLWPWYSAYIAAGGEVVPCCILGDPAVMNFGTISADRGFAQIWNSDEYASFRQCHSEGAIPGFCRQCYAERE